MVEGDGCTPSQLIRKRITFAPVRSRMAWAERTASAVLRNGSNEFSYSLVLPDTLNPRSVTSRPSPSRKTRLRCLAATTSGLGGVAAAVTVVAAAAAAGSGAGVCPVIGASASAAARAGAARRVMRNDAARMNGR